MNIKKIVSLLLVLFATACEVLDVEPYHSIPADQAITSRDDVVRAINGTYAALQSAGYYGRNFLVIGDLAADNLTWTGTTAGYNQIDNNSILSDNVIVEGIWSDIYSMISRANTVIEQIPAIEELSGQQAEEFLAEVYFLRALGHFDLVRLFGPVPIRTSVAGMSDDDLNVPRDPVDQVYELIFEDLTFAASHLPSRITRGKATQAAALALLARVNMHYYGITQQQQYLTEAALQATRVIEDFNLELAPDYASLFDGSSNNESIFEVDFNEQDRNRLAEYFFPTSLSGRREFAPTSGLYNLYSANDLRRDASIAIDGGNLYAIKYNDIETGADNVYVLRLAEMYLIRAEANAIMNTSMEQVRDDVNRIRERADLVEVITTSPFLLERQVREMRQLEFAFEGHRWFDLVRTGRAMEELENVQDEYQTLFPIPLGELLTNFHEGMTQNPGY